MDLTGLVDESKFFPLLTRLQECLCRALGDAGGPDLCFCGVMVGQAPPPFGLMECKSGNCGVAWVRPVAAFPSSTFPLQDDLSARQSCTSPLAMQVEVGVARCAPAPRGRNAQPDEQDTFDALRLYMSDMEAVRKAIACCFARKPDGKPDRDVLFAMGQWDPLPLAARASGGAWTVWIG